MFFIVYGTVNVRTTANLMVIMNKDFVLQFSHSYLSCDKDIRVENGNFCFMYMYVLTLSKAPQILYRSWEDSFENESPSVHISQTICYVFFKAGNILFEI